LSENVSYKRLECLQLICFYYGSNYLNMNEVFNPESQYVHNIPQKMNGIQQNGGICQERIYEVAVEVLFIYFN
jgi:hypothetical protein